MRRYLLYVYVGPRAAYLGVIFSFNWKVLGFDCKRTAYCIWDKDLIF